MEYQVMTYAVKLDSPHIKSYATEANLETGLATAGLAEQRHLVVRNSEGRWTAVFPLNWLTEDMKCGAIPHIAAQGFMVVG